VGGVDTTLGSTRTWRCGPPRAAAAKLTSLSPIQPSSVGVGAGEDARLGNYLRSPGYIWLRDVGAEKAIEWPDLDTQMAAVAGAGLEPSSIRTRPACPG
jgi:hypothetical protein